MKWHLGYLDSLRGIAVIAVIMVHSSVWNNVQIALPSAIRAVTGSGQRRVALFIIISDALADLDPPEDIGQVFVGFQKCLYPHQIVVG